MEGYIVDYSKNLGKYEYWSQNEKTTWIDRSQAMVGEFVSGFTVGRALKTIKSSNKVINFITNSDDAWFGLGSIMINELFTGAPEVGDNLTIIYRTHKSTGATQRMSIITNGFTIKESTNWEAYGN